ncbi:MAG: hypothetical protein IJQ76_11565 [Prevotella sp.]|nr:hypothetical protein [Prevotella sp.]
MKTNLLISVLSLGFGLALHAPASAQVSRAFWGSVNGVANASLGDYAQHTGKLLLSWRMLPTDDENTSFDIFMRSENSNRLSQVTNMAPVTKATCYQTALPSTNRMYYLVEGGKYTLKLTTPAAERERIQNEIRATALDSFLVTSTLWQDKLPYVTIPLKSTEDVSTYSDIVYQANDCSVGDLDGDGQMEIVVKRLLTILNADGSVKSDGTGAGDSDTRARHTIIWDAYKLDGTLLWRLKSGPNIILGNSSNFAVADLDGDGKCEVVTRTSEGTVFGDGYEIPDTDGDNKTDYRSVWPAGHYQGDGPKGYGGPEFFSVIDGTTGKELARANFIARGKEGETPAELAKNWYENDWKWDPRDKKYQWKLANSFRLGAASFDGVGMQIFLGRGVYGRSVLEGWRYADGELTRMWKFDTDDNVKTNKDGKANSAYAGQGNHSFNVADLDGDGRDEVMYGSMAMDDDGHGLWSTGLGHGDANHVGNFLPDREGLQVYHCLENGKTMVALHDAATGATIWQKVGSSDNDTGRALVADINPGSPGCEMWWAGSNAYSWNGNTDLGFKPSSCNMAIWFDGTLSRQLINENIIDSPANGRTFTMYRYNESFNNGTKSNPGWYGDMLGDWREEVIVPDQSKVKDIKVFSTWYPTEHKFPWLMSDHTYLMSCINENVGYNQPTNLGYYLGSDLKSDAEAWAAAEKMLDWTRNWGVTSGIETIQTSNLKLQNSTFNLMGQKVTDGQMHRGLYIVNGKKVFKK